MNKEPIYLGDGAYVQFDEFGTLIITTNTHIIKEADNAIYLEPAEVQNLIKYLSN